MTDTPAAPAKDERPTAEAVERAMTYFAGKPKSFTGMPATLHGKTLAAHVAALTTQLEARDDETYEIGKRDGYESAVQDFDLATGGDGEFKGSTIPGETVDVPAMKARVLERLTRETARADAAEKERDELAANLTNANAACDRIAKERDAAVAEAKALREAAEQAYGYLWVTSAMVPKDDPVSLARKRLLDEIGGWNSAGQRRGIAFATDQFEVGPDGVRPKRATLAQPAAKETP